MLVFVCVQEMSHFRALELIIRRRETTVAKTKNRRMMIDRWTDETHINCDDNDDGE